MLAAPIPVDENIRLQFLQSLHVLDTGQDSFLQSLMSLVKESFGVETALISLVDANRQWFKARAGLDANSTGRDISFCGHAILGNEVFEINDTLEDDRFRDNPLVTGAPFIRFYAGYPLLNALETYEEYQPVEIGATSVNGVTQSTSAIGTLCIISSNPKKLTTKELDMLNHFGHIANGYLTEKYAHFFATPPHSFQQALANCHDQLLAVLDHNDELCFANERFKALLFGAGKMGTNRLDGVSLINYETNVLYTPDEQDHVYELETSEGQVKYVTINYTNFERNDYSEYRLMSIKDVTDIHASLELLQKSNEELDNFTYVASHDLKSPLNAIGKLASWVREDLGESIDESAQKHLNLLSQRTQRMMSLLDDLLEYSRVGRVSYKPSETSLKTIFERTISTLDINGSVTCSPDDMPLIIEVTPFTTVLRNIIQNAAKHCDKQKCVVHVHAERKMNTYYFSVADNGPGIPNELIPKALQAFQTLRPRDQVEGTGIGLSLVKKLLQLHSGELYLSNQPKGGLEVIFTWPVKHISIQD